MSVTVRPCRDAADVAAIEATCPTGPSEFHRRRFEHEGSVFLLAWADDLAVGHVLLLPESKYAGIRAALGPFPEVNGLGVAETHRRRGVASALMRAAAAQAVRDGADRLGLAVEPGNLPAARLYEALGYQRQPDLDVVDVWSWRDETGVEHEERDPCDYWVTALRPSP